MNTTRLTTVDAVPTAGSYRVTVTEPSGRKEEVILVRLEGAGGEDRERDGPASQVAAWKNVCMHEPDQRLDRGVGRGAAIRDGELVCPRHGSMFDAGTGYCDDGEAAGQTLAGGDVTVEDGVVYLTDETLTYQHEGGIEEDDGMPGSTSHIGF